MTAYVVDRPVKNDVLAPRWLGYAGGKSHALLVPAGPLESPDGSGTIVAVCKKRLTVGRLAGHGQKCKTCSTAMAEDTRKRGTGLTERTVDVVSTGAQDGAPRDAERLRSAEISLISGDAAEQNAAIGEQLALGDKSGAMESARVLDAQGASAPIPTAHTAPLGSRDHGRSDGVAMVRGANLRPVQPQKGWAAVAGTMAGPIGRERPDREASTVPMHGGKYGYLTRAQYDALSRSRQRKYWTYIAKQERYAKEHGRVARPAVTRPGTAGAGSRSFVEGKSAETERLMQQPRS